MAKVQKGEPPSAGGWIKFLLFALVAVGFAVVSAWVIYFLQVDSLIMVTFVFGSVVFWFLVWATLEAPCDQAGTALEPLVDGEFASEELPLGNMSGVAMLGLYLFCSYMLMVMLNGVMELLDGDPLASPLLQTELVSIDSWSYVHVQNFMMLGFVLPDKTLTMILYGIFWEVLEICLANAQATKTVINWSEPPINSIWDLWFNLLGYRLGEMLLHSWLESNRTRRKLQLKEGTHASQQQKLVKAE